MMEKFRRRLIILTMLFITIILTFAFVVVFIVSFKRVEQENFEKLTRVEQLNITGGKLSFSEVKQTDDTIKINRILPGAGVYFNVLVNEQGEKILVDSAIKLTDDDYDQAIQSAWHHKNKGTIKIDNRKWQYIVFSEEATIDLDQEVKGYDKDGKTHLIRFLDVTDSEKNVRSLAMTLSLVGLVLLCLFYLVIVHFSNKAIKPMSDAIEQQKNFIADASHELKTPLSIISTNLEVLYTNKEKTVEDQFNWIENIRSGTERMNQLISRLLTIAKTDNLFDQLDISDIQVEELLFDFVCRYKQKFAEKQITITTNLKKVVLRSDEFFLIQLFEIFLDNAYKYTNTCGSVEVSLFQEKKYTVIEFKNTGIGITLEELPRIFDRFYRTNEVRQHDLGSYGLGLSIAQNIIEQLGGEIHVASVPNEETIFTMLLPKKR